MGQYKEGDRVFHQQFGLGTVYEVMERNRMKVHFDHLGSKMLGLNCAPPKISAPSSESEYLNMARVLYVHHGHESHVVLDIGDVCIPAHMYMDTDLWEVSVPEEGFWDKLIWVNLTIYSAEVGPYEPTESNPLYGMHNTLWGDERMIGRVDVSTGVTVRRPEPKNYTARSLPPIEYSGVLVEGFGKVFSIAEDGDPIIVSCGVLFHADIERWDRPAILIEKGNLVTFKGHLVAFRTH